MKTALSALVVAVTALSAASAQDGVSGALPLRASWSGKVRITGDVVVPKGGQLVIAAGTVVTIAPQDGSRANYHPERIEIHVLGQLLVEGKVGSPVVFVPDDGLGDTSDRPEKPWHGIVLHDRADSMEKRSIVRGAQFWRAFAALQVPKDSPLIEDCVFHSCSEGIQVGVAYRDEQFAGVTGLADPEIRRCRFVCCGTGVYAEGDARATIEQSVFVRSSTGVGSQRPGYVAHLRRPGTRVIASAFLDLGCAVHGCAVVRDSWFWRCGQALRLSDYHDRLATDIDHAVFDNNLVEDVGELVVGDAGAVRDALRGAVRPTGPLEDLKRPWPPLPDALRLAGDSAGKGRGDGGRDLGPVSTGGVGAIREIVRPPWSEPALRGWLAAPVDPAKQPPAAPTIKLGARIGASWWAVADADEDGAIHLKQAFGSQRARGLLALAFDATAGGKQRLPWTGDVVTMQAFFDGKQVAKVDARRRFGASEPALEFDCPPGRHVLLVQLEGWGGDPRFAIGGASPLPPEAGEAPREVTFRVLARRAGKQAHFEAKPSALVHWQAAPETTLAVLRDAVGNEHALEWDWADTGVLRLKCSADVPAKQDVTIVWKGLRDLLGKPLLLEPTPAKMP